MPIPPAVSQPQPDAFGQGAPDPRYPMPFVRVELAVLSIVDRHLCVLLGKRAQTPFKGCWALPGGALRIDLDADLEQAARRVASERLQAGLPEVEQLCTIGRRYRDERATWAMAVIYRSMVRMQDIQVSAGKRLEELRWMPAEQAAQDRRLAFDHDEVIARAVAATRTDAEDLRLPRALFAERFTLGELQDTCSILCGRRLDKSSFRRRLAERDVVVPVTGEVRRGANRPAQLYELARGAARAGAA